LKKYLILIVTNFIFLNSFSQISYVKPLVGLKKNEVEKYFDSLNRLKNNSEYKILRDVNTYGDLILSVDFAVEDGDFYKCYYIATTFERVTQSGNEICVSQYISGDTKYAEPTLAFIKDNFQSIGKGKWQRPYSDALKNVIIVATFERKDGDYPSFIISFELKEVDQK
jgi:hypothetical protein